ncbi:MAG: hypothetical protein NTX88_05430, partial [Candidatus Atribacteria bacterium]|nr:hypothetical protein [Candidatus Atribacteria bacterium]
MIRARILILIDFVCPATYCPMVAFPLPVNDFKKFYNDRIYALLERLAFVFEFGPGFGIPIP